MDFRKGEKISFLLSKLILDNVSIDEIKDVSSCFFDKVLKVIKRKEKLEMLFIEHMIVIITEIAIKNKTTRGGVA